MSTLETILFSAFLTAVVIAPKALDAWLASREAARRSRAEWMQERVVGGAE